MNHHLNEAKNMTWLILILFINLLTDSLLIAYYKSDIVPSCRYMNMGQVNKVLAIQGVKYKIKNAYF